MKHSHIFKIESQKKFNQIYKYYNKNKSKINVNNYWNIRQDFFSCEFDKKKKIIQIYNESNLENFNLKNKNIYLLKFLLISIIKKTFYIFNLRLSKIDKLHKSYNFLRIYQNNISEIKKLSFSNLLLKLNKKYPERIFFLILTIKILNFIKFKKNNNNHYGLEIGSGPCILTGFLIKKYRLKFLVVDLPIQSLIGIIILNKYFPKIKICYLNYDDIIKKYNTLDKAFKKYDIIFISPKDIKKVRFIFSFILNQNSFQEMSSFWHKKYFSFFRKNVSKKNIFFNLNRKKKLIDKLKHFRFSDLKYSILDRVIFNKEYSNIIKFAKVSGGSFIVKIVRLNRSN